MLINEAWAQAPAGGAGGGMESIFLIIAMFFFGGFVSLIGCYYGHSTTGGSEGLGVATTATVVDCTLGVIVSDFFLTKAFLLLQ